MNIEKNMKCLITNCPDISQNLIDSKRTITIELLNGKITEIKLDCKSRYIKCFNSPFDITIIEILNSDLLNNDIYILDYDLDFIDNYKEY